MLRPVETPTREIKKLDGLWAFSLDRENCGIDQRWWESALQESRVWGGDQFWTEPEQPGRTCKP